MDLTFGARLRSQRESQQVALAAIAEETKINVALLEGLERDDLSRWPGGLFRRAYVRTYAQKIGLDPETVVREFVELYPDRAGETSAVEAIAQNTLGKRPKTRIGLILSGLAGLRPQRTASQRRIVTPETLQLDAQTTHSQDLLPIVPVQPEPDPVPEFVIDPVLTSEIDPSAPKLVVIPTPEASADSRRDVRALERDLVYAAQLCTRIGCARDEWDLRSALEDTVEILNAVGAILWAWEADREALFPAIAHGYPDELLARLPEVRRCADNAIAATLRCGQKQIVRSTPDASGALVMPLLTSEGCAGALALEFGDGGEQNEPNHALAAIITAQFSTLFTVTPAAMDEQWARPDQSLVAS